MTTASKHDGRHREHRGHNRSCLNIVKARAAQEKVRSEEKQRSSSNVLLDPSHVMILEQRVSCCKARARCDGKRCTTWLDTDFGWLRHVRARGYYCSDGQNSPGAHHHAFCSRKFAEEIDVPTQTSNAYLVETGRLVGQ